MSTEVEAGQRESQPLLHQHGVEVQPFGTMRLLPIALSHEARKLSAQLLNAILADSLILYSHYKKHHWLIAVTPSTSCICCSTSTLPSSSS
jgi:starvation-inducible DNA-binding protein